MKYGALPDSVLYALVNYAANFDMTTTEKLAVGQSLRSQTIDDMPEAVRYRVDQACEDIRRARCGECLNHIPKFVDSEVNSYHDESCSLHPSAS